MILPVRYITLLFISLFPLLSIAQITVTSPVSRMVFQRSLTNQATILVTGHAPSATTQVDARFVPLAVGQGSVTAWTTLPLVSGTSVFRGNVTASAGWYRLEVRAKSGTTVSAQTQVDRIGVGEVFVTAGQSNAAGGFRPVPGAVDDRVSCVDFRQDSLSEQLLSLQFSHISKGTNIGPSQPQHLWGVLGDSLVKRLNVPVLFLGAALGGTTSTQWQQSAAGNLGSTNSERVYRQMGVALLHYIRRTGARAVLWHQGEGDINSSFQTYYDNLKYVIGKSRQQVSFTLPWMVSRVSYFKGQTNANIIKAQNQLITDLPGLFPGPATDSLTGSENRPDDVHLLDSGMYRFINIWVQCLSTSFFQNAVPFTPAAASTLITSGYTVPLTRRPGETLVAASLRSDSHEADNQYIGQVVRVSDGAAVYESSPSTDNPILVTLPSSLPDGQYQLRTRSTHPVLTGSPGEPFMVQQSAPATALIPLLRAPVRGGSTHASIQRIGYRYESGSHGFYAMVQATAAVEVRLQRIDGGSFSDSNWNAAPSSSTAPDYPELADFNYIRNYPPVAFAVGGVEPSGRYRLSVRRQGNSSDGVWFDVQFLEGRNSLYLQETVPSIPPVLTLGDASPLPACLSGSVNVAIEVSGGALNSGNVFSVRLSDATGSFTRETTIGSGATSPIPITLPSTLAAGGQYRMRVVASNPAVASAPSQSFSICQAGADLSMTMRISARTPSVSQPITLTLVLTNAGPVTAGGVKVQSRLPNGMEFIDSPSSDVTATGNTMNINAGTLTNGTSRSFTARLKTNQEGFFTASAQITASNQTDPDSQPNSGTGDGQDDAATVDLRTLNAGDFVSVSPNPNQVALPPVQSNQPPAEPTKADLSLAVSASNLVVSSTQAVSVTLTASNRGGATATDVALQALLPAGWLVSKSSGLTINGKTVTGNVGSIPAGGSGVLILSVQPTQTGTLQAQVSSATPVDSDSTPNNGYQYGEDDEAALVIRVR